MIDIKHTKCIKNGYMIRLLFNLQIETNAIYYNEHKKKI